MVKAKIHLDVNWYGEFEGMEFRNGTYHPKKDNKTKRKGDK